MFFFLKKDTFVKLKHTQKLIKLNKKKKFFRELKQIAFLFRHFPKKIPSRSWRKTIVEISFIYWQIIFFVKELFFCKKAF